MALRWTDRRRVLRSPRYCIPLAAAAFVGLIVVGYLCRTATNSTDKQQLHELHDSHRSISTAGVAEDSHFFGPAWRTNDTISARTLFESKWIRFEDHTVRILQPNRRRKTMGGNDDDGGVVVTGWKWFDVSDQVNVLVSVTDDIRRLRFPNATLETAERRETDDQEYFVLFRQRKYGYLGDSLAVVGGLIEPEDADPLAAARREVQEELSLHQCASWHSFGSFRTDVNRGGGFVNLFLARRCVPTEVKVAALGVDDLEDQSNLVLMTPSALRDASLSLGAVKEVKWAAVIALSLLQLSASSTSESRK